MVPAGRVVAAMAVVALLLLLAGGADADCFDYCYKNCIANNKSMADYCNYACDKTCEPGGQLLRQRPLAAAAAAAPLRCQIDCVRRTCGGLRKDRVDTVACYRGCFDGCRTKTMPVPLRAAVDGDSGPVSETKKGDADQPSAAPDHPFHEEMDDVQSATHHPFHEKQEAFQPPLAPDYPFHEKQQDADEPTSVLDHRGSSSEIE